LTFALPRGNFWFKLSLSASILAITGLVLSRKEWPSLFPFKGRHFWLGPASAPLLYGIFWIGREVSSFIFPFASKEISNIYFNETQLDSYAIGVLLFFVMGPGKEICWHGFVQRSFSRHFGPIHGVLLTSAIYALVQVFALNIMLVLAAAICGLFWGVPLSA
jgi:membrane protease YdiL (CAAX protease family)